MKTYPIKGFFCSHGRMVIALLFFVTAINYLDRQSLSVIAPLLRNRLSFSMVDYSHIVFLFFVGYTIGQALDGKMIDRIGSRRGMLACVGLWSSVCMLHSLAIGVISLGILQLLLGVAEAGNWPGGVKVVAENFSPARRAFAIGVFNSGSTLGAVLAPPLVVAMVGTWGWRPMFVVIGAMGMVWVGLWSVLCSKEPAPAEATEFSSPPRQAKMGALLRERAVWGLMINRFLSDPIWWFYAFWLPAYLTQSRGFTLAQIGRTAWIPFAFAGAGGWCGGFASDALIRRGTPPVTARKTVMVIGSCLMFCGLPAFQVRSSALALALISVVVFGFTSWASNILSLATDFFHPEQVGQVTGLSGTAAAIGGMVFTLATGWLVQNISFGSVFIASAAMTVCALAVIFWILPQARRVEL